MKRSSLIIGSKPTPFLEIIDVFFKDGKKTMVPCKCICGTIKNYPTTTLDYGRASCGCMREYSVATQFRRKGTLVENGLKKCSSCQEVKTINNYVHCHNAKDNYSQQCNECHRYRRYIRLYNLNLEDYNNMLKKQDYKCAICERTTNELIKLDPRVNHLAIDHCHKTGKIRKLLCAQCNTAIGRFRDDPEIIFKAYKYLKDFEDSSKKDNNDPIPSKN